MAGNYIQYGEEQFIIADGHILQASRTTPGLWYEPTEADGCPCKGYEHSAEPKHCHHTELVGRMHKLLNQIMDVLHELEHEAPKSPADTCP